LPKKPEISQILVVKEAKVYNAASVIVNHDARQRGDEEGNPPREFLSAGRA
jgi:hypothetical protein